MPSNQSNHSEESCLKKIVGLRFGLRLRCTALVLLLVAAGLVSSARAQNAVTPPGNAPGTPPGSYALSNVETVSLYSGKVNAVVPLLKVGGRGNAGYTMVLRVDDASWATHSETHNGYTAIYAFPEPFQLGRSVHLPPFEFGVVTMRYSAAGPACPDPVPDGPPTCFQSAAAVMVFTEADGTEHALYDDLTGGMPSNLPPPYYGVDWEPAIWRGLVFSAKDGSGLTFVADPPPFQSEYSVKVNFNQYDIPGSGSQEETVNGYLKTRDGTVVRFENSRARWIRDRNGNQTNFHYEPYGQPQLGLIRLDKVTDSNNRVTDIAYGSGYDQIEYRGAGGQSRTITVNYASLQSRLRDPAAYSTGPIGLLFPADSQHGSPNGFDNNNQTFNPGVISTVIMPDQRSYGFYYNQYGELARLVSPAGAAIEYDYASGLTPNPQDGVFASGQVGKIGVFASRTPVAIYRRLLERREYANGGTTATQRTTYSRYVGSGTSPSGKVRVEQSDPATNDFVSRREHFFLGVPYNGLFSGGSAIGVGDLLEGREVKTDTLDLETGQPVLARTESDWNAGCLGGRASCAASAWSPFVERQTTSIFDATANAFRVEKKEFTYDRHDNLTDTFEFHYGAGSPGPLARRTHTDYETAASYADAVNGTHLRSLPTRQWVSSDADGMNKVSRTDYAYDEFTLGARPGISGHDSGYAAGLVAARGNPTRVTRYANAATATGAHAVTAYYDEAGNAVKVIDARGGETTIEFDDKYGAPDGEAQTNNAPQELGSLLSYAYPTLATNPMGHTTRAQYDYHLGAVVNTEDANGMVSSVAYEDLLDRPTRNRRAIGTPQAAQTTTDYDDPNRTVTVTTDLDTYDDNKIKSVVIYDGMGRTTESRAYESATAFITTLQSYDALGRVKSASNPFRATSDTTYGWTTTTYDALGRVKTVTKPDGTQLEPAYEGTKTLTTDQAGKKRLSDTNALGQLTDVWEITSAGEATGTVAFGGQNLTGYRTHYEYDTLGNLRQVTQGAQTRDFAYDGLSRLTSSANPEGGTTEHRYDANGNLVLTIDPRPRPDTDTLADCSIPYTGVRRATCNEYDALNRVKSHDYNDGTPHVTYTYDTLENGTGRLTSVGSSVATYSLAGYDALGRVTSSTQAVGAETYTMPDYRYNLAGGLTSQQYPSGKVVKTEYDAAGRLAGVKNAATGMFYAGGAAGDETNRVRYAAHGATSALKLGNGLWEHTDFNNRLQAVQIGLGTAVTDSGKLRLDFGYGTTDNNGNVRTQTITVAGSLALVQEYAYDPLNRLDIARETKVSDGAETWKQRFAYDRFGNRNFKSDETTDNVEGPQLSFGPTTNRITTAGHDYDEAGNLTSAPRPGSGPSDTYQFDGENRIVTVNGGVAAYGGATYYYDGAGRRVKKVLPSGTTVFVYNAMGQLIAEYATQATGGGVSYLTQDHLGSTRVVTDNNGEPKSRHDYLPFGEEVSASAVTGSGREAIAGYNLGAVRQKFTGYERDEETGLDFAQARYYASRQGRFTGVDPLLASARTAAPQTWNRYAYALNNPLRLIDPSGMTAYENGHDGEPVPVDDDVDAGQSGRKEIKPKLPGQPKKEYPKLPKVTSVEVEIKDPANPEAGGSGGAELAEGGLFEVTVEFQSKALPDTDMTPQIELKGRIDTDATFVSGGEPVLISGKKDELATYRATFTYRAKNFLPSSASDPIGTGTISFRAQASDNYPATGSRPARSVEGKPSDIKYVPVRNTIPGRERP